MIVIEGQMSLVNRDNIYKLITFFDVLLSWFVWRRVHKSAVEYKYWWL